MYSYFYYLDSFILHYLSFDSTWVDTAMLNSFIPVLEADFAYTLMDELWRLGLLSDIIWLVLQLDKGNPVEYYMAN
jgi:hypothetical protein